MNLSASAMRERLLSWPSHVRFDSGEQVGGRWWGPDVMTLPLAMNLVEMASVEGETIFDPFGGVGTIGIAASRLDRNFVGFEIDADRFATGLAHLPGADGWFNCSVDRTDLSWLTADALVTSPPFGRKGEGVRVFGEDN